MDRCIPYGYRDAFNTFTAIYTSKYPLASQNVIKYMATICRMRYLVQNVVELVLAMKESHMNGILNVL